MISASTLNDIINHIYCDSFFSGYSYSMYQFDEFLGQEVFAEYLLAVCEKPLQKLLDIFNKGQFNYYSAGMIRNIAYDKSGKINKGLVKYDKMKVNNEPFQSEFYDEEEFQMDEIKVKQLIKKLDKHFAKKAKNNEWFWYEKELFELYFLKGLSYRKISKLTGIPHTSIFLTIQNLIKEIRKLYGDDYQKLLHQ